MSEYKMVPVVPTEAMLQAALDCQDADPADGPESDMYYAYAAMLAAAPEPQACAVDEAMAVAIVEAGKIYWHTEFAGFKKWEPLPTGTLLYTAALTTRPDGLTNEEREALERCELGWNVSYDADLPILCAALRHLAPTAKENQS